MDTLGAWDNPEVARRTGQMLNEYFADSDAKERMSDAFVNACRLLDLDAKADWAPGVYDHTITNRPDGLPDMVIRRPSTLLDCIEGSLDYGNGPAHRDLYQLALELAYSTNAELPAKARALLKRMADKFAEFHVED